MRSRASAGAAIALLGAVLALASCSRPDADLFSGYAEGDFVYVGAPVAGRIETMAVQRGAHVEKGATLFQLEPAVQNFDRSAAAARAERAAAQTRNLQKGRRVEELRAIEQQLAQARATLEVSTKELARNESLVRQGFISASTLDELRAARTRDTARVAEVQAQLANARNAARPDEIAAAEAEQRAAESDLGNARWREAQTRGVVPAAATVHDVMYRAGEWASGGAPIVALLPDGAVKVRFFVPQAALAKIEPGAAVAVSCDGCPRDMTARVTFISTEAEFTPPVIYSNESRSKLVFMVEARPEGSAATLLKPGQPLDVRLTAPATQSNSPRS
ncbi:MAG: HlyD family efflux transporter periplasmic adaptor subunit [Burkholderiaceae bacterium]